jgi:hypothetical protein
MSKENVTVVKRVVAAGAAFVGVLALCASAGAAPVSPFREVAGVKDLLYVQSDGVRYAWATYWRNRVGDEIGVVVFDTVRGRNFRLVAPASGCDFVSIGGGFALWSCRQPTRVFLTNLSSGRSHEPVGFDKIVQKEAALGLGLFCVPENGKSVGRYWITFHCGNGFGPGDEPFFLNHRTGRLTKEVDPYSPDLPFIDLDYVGLYRPYCAPLADEEYPPPYPDYERPFALEWGGPIRLRRCGTKRAETLSRCLLSDCRTPQLGSGYVTWGEHKRVYAYLPRTRQRVLVGRAPTDFVRGRKLSVAHTCNRIFARWGDGIYEARFEPARGAPPCQHRGRRKAVGLRE